MNIVIFYISLIIILCCLSYIRTHTPLSYARPKFSTHLKGMFLAFDSAYGLNNKFRKCKLIVLTRKFQTKGIVMRYFAIILFLGLIFPPFLYLGLSWRHTSEDISHAGIVRLADNIAQSYGLDPLLFRAVISEESAWRIHAVSHKGAIGLGQLMPYTAKELGVDPYNPRQNLQGSARYLTEQIKRFGSVELALCAYNAGPAKIIELGRCPNFPETKRYVRRVLEKWRAFSPGKLEAPPIQRTI